MDTVELDADQRRVAARLGELLDQRGRPVKRRRGIYLHGRPGRGKTMLMNRFFDSVASKHKRRWHFHHFFARLHAAVHETGSIDAAVAALLGDAALVCFDEFHADDIGDAMLIARVLDALFARPTVLVLTSNHPPADLLPNPLYHDRFAPTIDRIVRHLDIVAVDGPVDYRTLGDSAGTGFAAGRYVITATTGVSVSSQPGRTVSDVLVGTRRIHVRATTIDSITVDFAALCATPTSAADYLELAHRFRRWTLTGVPRLREAPPDAVTRLVNLIDVLYDADLELSVHADAALPELLDGVLGVAGVARIRSRLSEISQPARVASG
ncbi:cell division protein ZapE [Nocardia noduli]|uniref:cell division protein ZapE n=1 Tax=Nocardia noduli TaxID=2815722 RepID=UPI001C251347|nr:cell division protein ZapE [Nocardia noduli]